MRRACREDLGVVREMAVDRQSLDACSLRDRADRRPSGPDFPMQRHHRLHDPLARLGLPFGALLHLVFARLHSLNIPVQRTIDKSSGHRLL
jgi:hypothetical protein